MRTAILLVLLLATSVLGQGSITTTTKTVVESQADTVKLGPYLVVPPTFKAEPFNLGYIQIDTKIPYDKLELNITSIVDNKVLPVPFMELNTTKQPYELLVTQTGWMHVEVFGIDFSNQLFIHQKADYELIPLVPPKPPEPPKPDVPADAFGNIGQRVAEWTKGVPGTAAVGNMYKLAAIRILMPSETVDSATATLKANLLLTPEYGVGFKTFSTNVNADLQARWPLPKGVLSDYWKCIALGLGVK